MSSAPSEARSGPGYRQGQFDQLLQSTNGNTDKFLPGAFLSLSNIAAASAPLKRFLAQISSPYAGYIKSILAVDYKTVGIDLENELILRLVFFNLCLFKGALTWWPA